MKKEKGYILRRIANEYNIFPCGEKAEETQEVLTLSESAAWIYEHVEEADSVKALAGLLSEEYGISVASALIFECFDHGCIGPDEGSGGVSGIWMGNSPGLKHRCDNRIERSSIGSFLEP